MVHHRSFSDPFWCMTDHGEAIDYEMTDQPPMVILSTSCTQHLIF